MSNIFKTKRFWAAVVAVGTAGAYVVQGNYPAAVTTVLQVIGLQ